MVEVWAVFLLLYQIVFMGYGLRDGILQLSVFFMLPLYGRVFGWW